MALPATTSRARPTASCSRLAPSPRCRRFSPARPSASIRACSWVRKTKRCWKPSRQAWTLVKDYGWLTILAKPLYWLLEKIHGFVGNWGWAIVLLVVLIKAAFYWLNATAYRSMAKMKAINPRIMEMRERLKSNPQQMQQEMMKIYREEKVNPLGGCLPIMIQIPVFIALYWVLLSSVEMRNAPWVLWIHDLSSPDPFFILPLVMAVTTLIQTALNPLPPDPLQAKTDVDDAAGVLGDVLLLPGRPGAVLDHEQHPDHPQQSFINNKMGVPLKFSMPDFVQQEARGEITPPRRLRRHPPGGGAGGPAKPVPRRPELGARAPVCVSELSVVLRFPSTHDPIVAIATAPGRGAVGIVRVSGKGLAPLVAALVGRELRPREATYLPFRDADGQAIDHGLALWFPGPHSYTGEDVLELQGHGGPVVLQLLLARCLSLAQATGADGQPLLPGLRLARAGEFTERAFLNDKLDLAQAEAVADLIDASTEAAARSASRSLAGVFSERIHALRDALIQLRMLVEATLDFPEEEIDFLQKADAKGQLERLRAALAEVRAQARQGALLRDGLKVVIAGQPNAGKSSLLNALAGAELAIVTPIAGTTRDVVQQTIQIEGVPLHVIDTAGLRDSPDVDEVEKIGIARAWDQIGQADAVLFLHDLTRSDQSAYQAADAAIAAALPAGVAVLQIWNKLDQCDALGTRRCAGRSAMETRWPCPPSRARALKRCVSGCWRWQAGSRRGDGLFMARERHLQALRAGGRASRGAPPNGWVRTPITSICWPKSCAWPSMALGEITGEFSADDLLGEIFSRFCIGK